MGHCSDITNHTVLCAIPVANAPCPENTCDHCLTISQYAVKNETYFNANSKLIFLEGKHNLSKNLTLQGRTLTLEGTLQTIVASYTETVNTCITYMAHA